MSGAITAWVRALLIGCALGALSILAYAGEHRIAREGDLRAAPLAWEPMYQRGVAVLGAGDTRRADALLDAALRRNPRAPAIRIALLRSALAEGNVGRAFVQLDALDRLAPRTAGRMLAILARTVDDDSQAAQIETALAPYPDLSVRFIRAMISAGKPAALIADIGRALPARILATPEARALVVDQLVRAGRYGEARRLWAHGHPPKTAVGDPTFDDATRPPPFGWQLSSGPFGAAERDDGGLAVIAYGRRDGVVARALIDLPPGRYAARLTYRQQPGYGGAIALRVRCATTGVALAALPIASDRASHTAILKFGVPVRGCAGQYLDLAANRVAGSGDPQQLHLIRIDVLRDSQ